jgi:hypothetical protein
MKKSQRPAKAVKHPTNYSKQLSLEIEEDSLYHGNDEGSRENNSGEVYPDKEHFSDADLQDIYDYMSSSL